MRHCIEQTTTVSCKNIAGVSIADAVADLGFADAIKSTFTGFQKYLYGDAAA